MNTGGNVRKSRALLVFIALLFALPLVIAWVMNFYFTDWRPAGTSNYGRLVQPARPLTETALREPGGSPLDAHFFRGEWTLVYIGDPSCAETCRQNLYKMRQVRLAQGKNFDRIKRLMVITRMPDERDPDDLAHTYPGLRIAVPVDRRAFVDQFRMRDNEDTANLGRIYLVDPLGNLMMSYEAEADPGGIIEDLERLLKASYVG